MLRRYPLSFPKKLTEDPNFEYVWMDIRDYHEAILEGYEMITEDKHPEVVADLRKMREVEVLEKEKTVSEILLNGN